MNMFSLQIYKTTIQLFETCIEYIQQNFHFEFEYINFSKFIDFKRSIIHFIWNLTRFYIIKIGKCYKKNIRFQSADSMNGMWKKDPDLTVFVLRLTISIVVVVVDPLNNVVHKDDLWQSSTTTSITVTK